ncbi:MAG: hypothetical protein GY945_07250 [Rhodobacteraceae bacterium]|nr:hypothetical protein [Paracoccaceae bacterium]
MLRPHRLALLATPVQADIVLPDGRIIDCYCTDKTGGRVELGEVICLFVDGRAFMARCEMSLNNPMWRETGETCQSSAIDRLRALQPDLNTSSVDTKI